MALGLKEKADKIEQFVADILYDRRDGFRIRLIASILKLLSYVFSGIAGLRYLLYKNRFFRSRTLGCLVVVVGNLTVGGTGKTPIVEKFARNLEARGRKVAILSRGYKSKAEPWHKRFWRWLTHGKATPPKVVSDGETVFLDSEIAGDEPYMLAKNLPGVIVLADKDRVKAGLYAIEKFGADTLILDDGFQYLTLKGRLNLLLIDKTNPFGNGNLLPRGILREPIRHLKRASYIFLTKSDGQPDLELERTIRKYKPNAEIIECAHEPQYLCSVNEPETTKIPLEALKNVPIAAFSGIAVPEGFERILNQLGAKLLFTERFADHHRFTYDEMADFFHKAEKEGAQMIITTEKDAVRISKMLRSPVPLYYLRLEIDILSGAEDFEKALSDICFPKSEMKTTRAVA